MSRPSGRSGSYTGLIGFNPRRLTRNVVYIQDFHKELVEKRKSVEKLFRNASTTAAAAAAGETSDKDETAAMSESKQKLATLQQKWNMLWRLSLDTKKKLQDNFAALLQV